MIPANGLYGLFRLDGGPVDPADAAALGLSHAAGPALAAGVDLAAPATVHRSDAGGQIDLLVGDIDEPEALAARLDLAADAPPIDLARAALERFGADLPVEMLGEWVLLRWEPAGRLTLIGSAARRSRLFYAMSDTRCAVAPDLFALARLPWIGREVDEAGLLFHLGAAGLRTQAGATTMLPKVKLLLPGETLVISAGGTETRRADALTPQPRRTGTFEDACAAGGDLLGRIMRERLARHPAAALMLSGGLDSSLLAWAAADQRGAGSHLHLLTSVAPPGSGLSDESAFAGIVASALGLACVPVHPPDEADIYRPAEANLRGANGPILSNRHILATTFHDSARGLGASVVIDGCYGEFSFTGYSPLPTVRQRASRLARRVRRPFPGATMKPEDAFHVRLSARCLAQLPEPIRSGLAIPYVPPKAPRTGLWGYAVGADRALGHPTEFFPGALRFDYPYRDIRLLRFFAGWPMSFFKRDGVDRAPVRQVLKGRLPDTIRLRTRGMPATPDQMQRLQRQAPAARGRIAAFRKAEVDEWLDLDWLDAALAAVAERGPAGVDEANIVQLTAMNAEFLTWWRTGG